MNDYHKPYWNREKQQRCYRNPVPVDERYGYLHASEVEPRYRADDAGHDYGDLFDHLDTALRNLVRCALTMEDVAMEEDFFVTEYGVLPVHLMPGWAALAKNKRRRVFSRADRDNISLPRVERRP